MMNSGLREKFKGIASTSLGSKRKKPIGGQAMKKNTNSLGVLKGAGNKSTGPRNTLAIQKLTSALGKRK